ncbi:MAG: hypothetical protein AB8B78_06375 [Polaribacter sp.]
MSDVVRKNEIYQLNNQHVRVTEQLRKVEVVDEINSIFEDIEEIEENMNLTWQRKEECLQQEINAVVEEEVEIVTNDEEEYEKDEEWNNQVKPREKIVLELKDKERFDKLILDNDACFAENICDLGKPCNVEKFVIVTSSKVPIYQEPVKTNIVCLS